MILNWIFIGGGILLFYGCWRASIVAWTRLSELGITHNKSSTVYFDSVLYSSLIALLFSRLTWMILNVQVYVDVPWGVLPYSRSASEFSWFTLFPWRFFRVQEGIYVPLFWLILAVGIVFSVFIPTIRLARKLRLEKRGVMRSFVVKSIIGIVAVIGFFGSLIYYSL